MVLSEPYSEPLSPPPPFTELVQNDYIEAGSQVVYALKLDYQLIFFFFITLYLLK
jgi:hypothetical protein